MTHDPSQCEPERISGYVWRTEPLSLRLTQSWERIVPDMPRQGWWDREALESEARRQECDGVTVWLEDRPLLTQVLHEEVAAALIEAWVLDEPVKPLMISEIASPCSIWATHGASALPSGDHSPQETLVRCWTR